MRPEHSPLANAMSPSTSSAKDLEMPLPPLGRAIAVLVLRLTTA